MSGLLAARILVLLFLCCAAYGGRIPQSRPTIAPRSSSSCQPFHATFNSDSPVIPSHRQEYSGSTFVATSEEGSYKLGNGGLELYLVHPDCEVTRKDKVNDIVGDGATINSTFTLKYGKVTFEMSAPTIAGVVSAAILIAEESDEIDVELVGGDPKAWQTNVFAPNSEDKEPLWGVFGTVEDLLDASKIDDVHKYMIDWNEDRICWSVDGKVVRTLKKGQTNKEGAIHYPSHAARIQVGIWDASNPAGTSEWAHGPINWDDAPERMTTYVKSITVECPY